METRSFTGSDGVIFSPKLVGIEKRNVTGIEPIEPKPELNRSGDATEEPIVRLAAARLNPAGQLEPGLPENSTVAPERAKWPLQKPPADVRKRIAITFLAGKSAIGSGCSATIRCSSEMTRWSDIVTAFFTVPVSSNSTSKFTALQNGICVRPESVSAVTAADDRFQRAQKNHGETIPVSTSLNALRTSSLRDWPALIVPGSGNFRIRPNGPAICRGVG